MAFVGEQPLVSIITVNYNGTETTRQLLKSLREIRWKRIEIIVVDNSSRQPPDELVGEFPEIILIKSDENLGFAGGNNLGICAAEGEFLLFLNNDTEVDPNFLEPLVNLFRTHPKAGMASPKILFDENGLRKRIQFAGSPGLHPYTLREGKGAFLETDNGQHDIIRPTKLVHGAAMMVPMHIVQEVGPMPDIYFLYYEEHDWCSRIRQAGYETYYVGHSKIWHKESASVGPDSPLKSFYMVRGRLLYTRRNRNGMQQFLALLFFGIAAFPRHTLSFMFKAQWKQFGAYLRGIYWHLGKRTDDIQQNPKMVPVRNGMNTLTGTSGERLKTFL